MPRSWWIIHITSHYKMEVESAKTLLIGNMCSLCVCMKTFVSLTIETFRTVRNFLVYDKNNLHKFNWAFEIININQKLNSTEGRKLHMKMYKGRRLTKKVKSRNSEHVNKREGKGEVEKEVTITRNRSKYYRIQDLSLDGTFTVV